MNYCYRFPVVKGIQAGREYYIGMVPLKTIGKMFIDDDEYVLPEFRAQRRLNETRIPEIKNYILDNPDTYVFSALAASIDGDFKFVELEDGLGILEVDMDSKFLINDGQHRKAAILEAIKENEKLGNETISVVFFQDLGLARSQQMFTDLNKHAVKTSNSIAELYDSRDKLAVVTRNVVSSVAFFEEYVDKEKDMLGKYSSALFTLNNIYNANKKILRRNSCDEKYEQFINRFWNAVAQNMTPWNEMHNKRISKTELREKYIAVQAVVIQAFGRVGGYIYENDIDIGLKCIEKINDINWRRNAKEWQQRVIKTNGRMINNERAILLAGNVIKKHIGLYLTDDEIDAENELKKMR